jgi:hypothetical protein
VRRGVSRQEGRTDQVSGPFDDAELIFSYSRAQAIEDGVLVDVTEWAAEEGFKWPMAMTRAAWQDLVAWDPDNKAPQDERGRFHDVAFMLRSAIARHIDPTDRVTVDLVRIPNRRQTTVPRPARFWAHVGPGDTPDPVITLMLEGED